jgi:hypothetical protein
MKRKIIFTMLALAVLVCLFSVSVSAAAPNKDGEIVILSDNTALPLWDTEGDALIWYKSTANADDGYANYDYIKAQASEVEYKTSWAGNINGVFANQVGTVTITVDGNTYGNGDIVVFNIKDEDVVVKGSLNDIVKSYAGKTIGELIDHLNTLKGKQVETTLTEYRGINRNGDVQTISVNGYNLL